MKPSEEDELYRKRLAFARRMEAGTRASPFTFLRPSKPVDFMSAAEVHAYVKKVNRIGMTSLLLIGAWILWGVFKPESMRPAPPEWKEKDAGLLQAVEVHHTTFGVSTTVKTDLGIYQVTGSVSAAVGDPTRVRWSEPTSMDGVPKLCIDSSIKKQCYRIE